MLGIVDYRTAGLLHFTIVLRITRRFQSTMAINSWLTYGAFAEGNESVPLAIEPALGVKLRLAPYRVRSSTE